MRHIDIYDAEQYRLGVPHEKFTALRALGPIHRQHEPDGPGYWALVNHADVVAVGKNPRLFSSCKGGINIPDASEEDLSIGDLILITMAPPDHAKYRRLVSTGFTPKMTQRLEGAIRRAVSVILDGIREREEYSPHNGPNGNFPFGPVGAGASRQRGGLVTRKVHRNR